MPKDYVHRAHDSSRNWRKPSGKKNSEKHKKHFPWLFIFIVLIVIGLGVGCGLYFYNQLSQKSDTPIVDQPTTIVKKTSSKHVVKTIEKQEAPPVHFDFYSMLPKNTVSVVSDTDEQVQSSAAKKSDYVLQVVSLSDENNVKAFETKLSEIGFRSKVVPVQRVQTKWYRLQVGPFSDVSAAQAARDTLSQQEISSVVLKFDRK